MNHSIQSLINDANQAMIEFLEITKNIPAIKSYGIHISTKLQKNLKEYTKDDRLTVRIVHDEIDKLFR